jgi:predicted thioesterase
VTTLDPAKLNAGRRGHARLVVGAGDTARTIGSGSLEVLATPTLVALCERAAVDCLAEALPDGHTTLGVEIAVTHEAPTVVGGTVEATAEIVSVRDRTIEFRLEARDAAGRIGGGRHLRALVESGRFLDKAVRRASRAAGAEA